MIQQSIIQNVEVKFCYAVHFTEGAFEPQNSLLREYVVGKGAKVCVVVDRQVAIAQPNLLAQIKIYLGPSLVGDVLLLPGGEACKNNPALVQAIHQVIDAHGICRHSYLIAIGGGALLDMAGYAAATAHRGVRLIRMPTTVLAQNDSGVGVKNGINAFGKKNFLGTFAPPFAVINDRRFLKTLSRRDWIAGLAEAVKIALLKDGAFFSYLEQYQDRLVARDAEIMGQVIYRCAQMHLAHIADGGDPFERGSSRPLDFGHWAAHKLENLTDYSLRHGEAVAVGIALDTTYSFLKGLLHEYTWRRVLELLTKLGFALSVPQLASRLDTPEHPESILHGLQEFREHLGGRLTVMLLKDIGAPVEAHAIDLETMRRSIALLQEETEQPRGGAVWNPTVEAA
jgi:3-dehydroquinate synthase